MNDLTDHNESRVQDALRPDPWSVSDAPDDFIEQQLAAIVGVQLEVVRVEAKRKAGQNKSGTDRSGSIDGLRRNGRRVGGDVADLMDRTSS